MNNLYYIVDYGNLCISKMLHMHIWFTTFSFIQNQWYLPPSSTGLWKISPKSTQGTRSDRSPKMWSMYYRCMNYTCNTWKYHTCITYIYLYIYITQVIHITQHHPRRSQLHHYISTAGFSLPPTSHNHMYLRTTGLYSPPTYPPPTAHSPTTPTTTHHPPYTIHHPASTTSPNTHLPITHHPPSTNHHPLLDHICTAGVCRCISSTYIWYVDELLDH